jgi:4-coumarate--CoA ligase (photoactive yellow protein activation family)
MTARVYPLFPELPLDHRIALGGSGPRSLAELRADVGQVAERLLPGPDSGQGEVLIACTDRYLFAVGLLASWSRGYAAALPPSHRPNLLCELAGEASIVATLHDGEAEQGFDLRGLPQPGRSAGLAPLPEPAAGTHLVTLYTSGSTGAAQKQHKCAAQLLGETEVLNARFGAELTRVLCTLPARHIYGLLFGVLLPMRAGAAFVRSSPLHAGAILEMVQKHEVDALCAVPAHLQGLASASPGALGRLRRVFSSGAELRTEAFDALRGLGLSVAEVFGSTETGGIAYREAPGAAFQPFQDVRVAADEDDRLLLYSPRLAPQTPQPYAGSDRVSVLESGHFRHLGRADRIAKIAGTRVSLDELEQRARSLPGVHEVAVVAREVPLARSSEVLLAAVADGWDGARMRSALSAWFEPVAIPRRYRFVAELPREPTGKLRKDAVLALFEAAPGPAHGFERGRPERDGDRLRVTLRPPPELIYFQGHFDDWPVLPGVTQLGLLAVGEARATWPELGRLSGVRRLKFKRPVRPGEALDLELERLDATRVDFSICHAGEACSSGSLVFGATVPR